DRRARARVVVGEAQTRADRGQARLDRRHLPLIVARSEIVQFAADVELADVEQRPLETERVAAALRRGLVGEMTGDKRMVEALMIEERDAHPERGHEPVDGREPVLALAE